MKILHLLERFAPAGGIETYVIDLLPLLAARGHDNVVIYRHKHPRTPPSNNKSIYHIPVTHPSEQGREHIVEIIQDEDPDAIYLHDVYDPTLIKQVAELVPCVGYVHIFYPVCPGLGKLYKRGDEICTRPYGLGCIPMIYLRRCASARLPQNVYRIMKTTGEYLEAYRSLPRVIVASQYMEDLMIQNGVESVRIEKLPYFIPMPSTQNLIDPTEKSQNIMFAGRLEYEKGVPYLLEALRLIPEKYRLLIAGDGSLKQQYIQLAKEMGVANRVEFRGWLSPEELNTAYRHSAVTVMPTIMAEPFGKVGVEAMANSRPVVAFDVGGISDWLKDGHNGFLVPPRDIEQLASKLTRLLTDVDLAARMGSNGRKFVEEHYASDLHVDKLVDIFNITIT